VVYYAGYLGLFLGIFSTDAPGTPESFGVLFGIIVFIIVISLFIIFPYMIIRFIKKKLFKK